MVEEIDDTMTQLQELEQLEDEIFQLDLKYKAEADTEQKELLYDQIQKKSKRILYLRQKLR